MGALDRLPAGWSGYFLQFIEIKIKLSHCKAVYAGSIPTPASSQSPVNITFAGLLFIYFA